MQNEDLPPAQPEQAPGVSATSAELRYKRSLPLIGVAIILIMIGLGIWLAGKHQPNNSVSQPAAKTAASTKQLTQSLPGVQLDQTKNYGNKYADGVLPVGDNKYVTDTPKQGYIYVCGSYANNLKQGGGGAGARGPWFSSDGTTYDTNKKLHVQGSVTWKASFSNQISNASRVITTNDLPSHPTGIFPISATDPAYAYDRNPNSIKAQSLSFALNASPTYGTPQCMGGQSGIMMTGVALFNGFDAGGRDAGAWEVQDNCDGHPEKEGEYHYHTLSSCIKDVSVKTVIGFALDGFPITGPEISDNNILTTSDLDECHGLTSQIILDGKTTTSYHYVMTEDFPYSVSCFRSTPIQPPGQPSGLPQR